MRPDSDGDRPRLASMTLENFRGVRDRLTLDLDASAVLLWGPNGTGKTTIFDALLWLIRGNIPRLSDLTMRRNEDYIPSSYRQGQPSTVTVNFRANERQVSVTRRGDGRESYLELREGETARSGDAATDALQSFLVGGQLSLPEVLRTSGLLQQDDLRLLLRDKPDQRYRQLLRLLGLEVLELFERQTRTWLADAREAGRAALQVLDARQRAVTTTNEELETLQVQTAKTAEQFDIVRYLRPVVESLSPVVLVLDTPSSTAGVAALAAEADNLAARAQTAVSQLGQLPPELPGAPVDEAALLQRRESAADDVQAASRAVAAATTARQALVEAHDALNALAAAAIPMLEEEHADELVPCPVCQTMIDARRVIADLQERAQQGSAIAAADTELARARAAESEARQRLAAVEDELAAARALAQARSMVETSVSQVLSMITSVGAGARLRIALPEALPESTRGTPVEVLSALHQTRDSLSAIMRTGAARLAELSRALKRAAESAQAARVAAERVSQLPRVEARLTSLREQAAAAQQSYGNARKRETAVKLLADTATAAITDIFRERFATLEPLMNDVYARLDPHPAFTRLDFKIETYRARGTATASVIDEEAEVSANPLLVFSSAQANIVVLAAFLALGWAAGSDGLPFVLMDDPLQALDDVNVLGFADLSRHLRRQRQVVIATHEERFARTLERKLIGRHESEDLLIHRFVSWNREGPKVETRRIDGHSAPGLRVLAS